MTKDVNQTNRDQKSGAQGGSKSASGKQSDKGGQHQKGEKGNR